MWCIPRRRSVLITQHFALEGDHGAGFADRRRLRGLSANPALVAAGLQRPSRLDEPDPDPPSPHGLRPDERTYVSGKPVVPSPSQAPLRHAATVARCC